MDTCVLCGKRIDGPSVARRVKTGESTVPGGGIFDKVKHYAFGRAHPECAAASDQNERRTNARAMGVIIAIGILLFWLSRWHY